MSDKKRSNFDPSEKLKVLSCLIQQSCKEPTTMMPSHRLLGYKMYSLGYNTTKLNTPTVSLLRRTKELDVIPVFTLLFAKKKKRVY